jgi:hypothetical protein
LIRTFIIEYWLEALFGVLLAILGGWCKILQGKLKQRQAEDTALKEGMKAILHDMLFQICEKYLALGYIPLNEFEDISNREKTIYEAYSGLKGNSTGTDIHKKFKALPTKDLDTM